MTWIRSPHVPGRVDYGQIEGDPADDEVHRLEVIRKQEERLFVAALDTAVSRRLSTKRTVA